MGLIRRLRTVQKIRSACDEAPGFFVWIKSVRGGSGRRKPHPGDVAAFLSQFLLLCRQVSDSEIRRHPETASAAQLHTGLASQPGLFP